MEDVSGLIKQFIQMRKMMKKTGLFSRLMSGGAEVSSETLPAGAGGAVSPLSAISTGQSISRKEQEKKKRLAKLQKKERQKQRRKKR